MVKKKVSQYSWGRWWLNQGQIYWQAADSPEKSLKKRQLFLKDRRLGAPISENSHSDMCCSLIEGNMSLWEGMLLLELKLRKHICSLHCTYRKTLLKQYWYQAVKVHCLLVQSEFQILFFFHLPPWSSKALWNTFFGHVIPSKHFWNYICLLLNEIETQTNSGRYPGRVPSSVSSNTRKRLKIQDRKT